MFALAWRDLRVGEEPLQLPRSGAVEAELAPRRDDRGDGACAQRLE